MSLSSLPDAVQQNVCGYLDAPDLLKFLSSHREFHRLGKSGAFWRSQLLVTDADLDEDDEDGGGVRFSESNATSWNANNHAKQVYLRKAYTRLLPTLRWLPLRQSQRAPSAREGHLCCLLGNLLVLTGGYSDDHSVHTRHVQGHDDWVRLREHESSAPCFAYGASLTPLDDSRAIRFGGFRSGGYSGECSQLALLTVNNGSARWEIIRATCRPGNENRLDESFLARAYHTATLIQKRYLIILGGMQSRSSIWNPVVLDTHTWTWIPVPVGVDAPSPRHGHSVVFDRRRDRLVLFGGGSGSDLLRSGMDNSEVWELSEVRNNITDRDRLWQWRLIHNDQNGHHHQQGGTGNHTRTASLNRLSPAETLCLGRCHVAHRVSPETVMLVFGSGRPTTNGILVYNLVSDSFFRPKVQGPLPMPRFTCASVFLKDHACIFVHSGYSTQRFGVLQDSLLLDLAPALHHHLPLFAAVDPQARNHEPVTDQHVQRERHNNMEPFQIRLGLMARLSALGLGGLDVIEPIHSSSSSSNDEDYEPMSGEEDDSSVD